MAIKPPASREPHRTCPRVSADGGGGRRKAKAKDKFHETKNQTLGPSKPSVRTMYTSYTQTENERKEEKKARHTHPQADEREF
jgi:hypothetical protein